MFKILIVDDAKIMRNIIKSIFSGDGEYQIIEAANGEEAVEMYRKHLPNVVTMDITMDRKNGVEATREIMTEHPNANIIMITSLGQEALLNQCLEAGARDYIVKPFSKERVRSAILKALKPSYSVW